MLFSESNFLMADPNIYEDFKELFELEKNNRNYIELSEEEKKELRKKSSEEMAKNIEETTFAMLKAFEENNESNNTL